eukprot:s1867_g8.t1
MLPSLGRQNYIQDVEEKLSTGSDRLRKRVNKETVKKERTAKVEVAVPGTFVELDVYKQDFKTDDPATKGHSVHKVEDPVSMKQVDAVFIPTLKRGYFQGSVKGSKKIRLEEAVDTNSTALRDGQVTESFQDEMGRFNKELPEIKVDAQTWEQASKIEPPDDGQEADAGNGKGGKKKKKTADGESDSEIDDEDALKMALELARREDKFSAKDSTLNKDLLDNLNTQQVRSAKSQPAAPGTMHTSPRKGRKSQSANQERSRTPVPRPTPTVCPQTPATGAGKAKAKAKTQAKQEPETPKQETSRKSRRTAPAKSMSKGPEAEAVESQAFAETQNSENGEEEVEESLPATPKFKALQKTQKAESEHGEDLFGTASASEAAQTAAAEGEEEGPVSVTLSIETVTVKQLEIMRADGGILFAKPDVAGVTKEKWAAMIKSFAEPLGLLHNMLSGEEKVKDQELKSCATSLRKKAAGAAKKAGLKPGAEATKLANKFKAVAALLEEFKAFRAKVCSTKSSLDGPELKADIESIWGKWVEFDATINLTNSAGEQEERTVKYVEFPDLWVRAWLSLGPSLQLSVD